MKSKNFKTNYQFNRVFLSLFIIFFLISNNVFPLTLTRPTEDTQATVLWKGFQHVWEKTPHRLNRFGSYFRNIDYDADTGDIYAQSRSLFQVGALNDTGTVKIKGQFVESSVLGFHEGNVKEDCLTVPGRIGQSSTVRCHVSLNLKNIGFENYDHVTAILRGFQLTEVSYESGYNTRGFAIRIIPIEHNEETYEFDVLFFVYPEHAPDRPLPSWVYLGDSCGDCDTYTYNARIYYTLVGVKDDDGSIVDSVNGGTNSYSQYMKMSPNKVPDMADISDRQTSIVGIPGLQRGIVAIQGFKWILRDWDKTKKDGRYIRELRFNISNTDYDSQTGKANFQTKMYFSNSGLWPEGFDVKFTMWNSLIQFNDRSYKASSTKWYKGELQKGEVSVTKDIDYNFDS